MSDWEPLIYSLIFLFFVSGFLIFMLDPFVDIEELTEDTWIQTFFLEEIIGFIFDIFRYILTAITWALSATRFSLFNLVQSPPPEIQQLTVTGTGGHENITLDGNYVWRYGRNYQSSEDIEAWIVVDDTEDIGNARLRSREFLPTIQRWFGLWETIYESDDPWTDLVLLKTDYDFNPTAEVSEDLDFAEEEEIPPFEAVGRLRDFVNDAKVETQQRIRVLGLIPDSIGIPLMIIIIISSLITLIKLLPWT